MEDPVHIAIIMERSDVDKLARLAGAEAQPSEYLTRLVRLLHKEHELHGRAVDPEMLVNDIHMLIEQRERLERHVHSLTRRTEALIVEYSELLARVHTMSQFMSRRGGRISH